MSRKRKFPFLTIPALQGQGSQLVREDEKHHNLLWKDSSPGPLLSPASSPHCAAGSICHVRHQTPCWLSLASRPHSCLYLSNSGDFHSGLVNLDPVLSDVVTGRCQSNSVSPEMLSTSQAGRLMFMALLWGMPGAPCPVCLWAPVHLGEPQ